MPDSLATGSVSGDASVGVIRGKARQFLDVKIEVAFRVRVGGDDQAYKGTLTLKDYSADAATEPVDVEVKFSDGMSTSDVRCRLFSFSMMSIVFGKKSSISSSREAMAPCSILNSPLRRRGRPATACRCSSRSASSSGGGSCWRSGRRFLYSLGETIWYPLT